MSDADSTEHNSPWFSYATAIVFIAGVGFFVLSYLLLAVWPGERLQQSITARAPANMPDYTAQELHGRDIYAREGCGYCHTQQVRFVPADVARWGAPTEAWETRYDYPQLWGTRRIGPDLARETGVRSDDWQLTHLYNPRSIVRDSVMPAYPWLYQGSAAAPSDEARAVVAYLQSLGRARQLSGYDQALAAGGGAVRMDSMGESSLSTDLTPRPDANAALARNDGPAPSFGLSSNPAEIAIARRRGAEVFAANCAGCHGAQGAGDGPAAATLQPAPANLRAATFADERIASVLWNGVVGSAMPAWRDLPQADLQAVASYVSTLHTAVATPATDPSIWAQGAAIFATNCASCHGPQGAGDGPAGRNFARTPTNFHLKQPDVTRAQAVLAIGVAGSAMPSWSNVLKPAERDAVIVYLRSLYGQPITALETP